MNINADIPNQNSLWGASFADSDCVWIREKCDLRYHGINERYLERHQQTAIFEVKDLKAFVQKTKAIGIASHEFPLREYYSLLENAKNGHTAKLAFDRIDFTHTMFQKLVDVISNSQLEEIEFVECSFKAKDYEWNDKYREDLCAAIQKSKTLKSISLVDPYFSEAKNYETPFIHLMESHQSLAYLNFKLDAGESIWKKSFQKSNDEITTVENRLYKKMNSTQLTALLNKIFAQ